MAIQPKITMVIRSSYEHRRSSMAGLPKFLLEKYTAEADAPKAEHATETPKKSRRGRKAKLHEGCWSAIERW